LGSETRWLNWWVQNTEKVSTLRVAPKTCFFVMNIVKGIYSGKCAAKHLAKIRTDVKSRRIETPPGEATTGAVWYSQVVKEHVSNKLWGTTFLKR
jgi:hypothetical protein